VTPSAAVVLGDVQPKTLKEMNVKVFGELARKNTEQNGRNRGRKRRQNQSEV
jgi:hypothetical protein